MIPTEHRYSKVQYELQFPEYKYKVGDMVVVKSPAFGREIVGMVIGRHFYDPRDYIPPDESPIRTHWWYKVAYTFNTKVSMSVRVSSVIVEEDHLFPYTVDTGAKWEV